MSTNNFDIEIDLDNLFSQLFLNWNTIQYMYENSRRRRRKKNR